jgi:peroxiredoxin
MGAEDVMIQADIGGGARVTPGHGVQRPGYMVRDFALKSSEGKEVRASSFRGQANLVLVFPRQSDAMHAFLSEASRRRPEFSEQDAVVIAILPNRREEQRIPHSDSSPIFELYDETLHVHHLSGTTDESGSPIPMIYVTDRFGEIVSTHVAADHAPPSVKEILHMLEFVNHQCPECEPPEWPR